MLTTERKIEIVNQLADTILDICQYKKHRKELTYLLEWLSSSLDHEYSISLLKQAREVVKYRIPLEDIRYQSKLRKMGVKY